MAHQLRHTLADFTPEDIAAAKHLVAQGLPPRVVGWVFGAEEAVILEVLETEAPTVPVKTTTITITGTDYHVEVSEK